MKHLILLVSALAVFWEANLVKAEIRCEDYSSTANAKFVDLVGKHYIRYMSVNQQDIVTNITNKVDGGTIDVEAIGTSNNFTLTSKTIGKNKDVFETNSTLYADDSTHIVYENNRGLEEKYYVTSLKPETSLLVYICNSQRHDRITLVRMVLTKNLTQDVTQALKEDQKHNFNTKLVKFPFNHKDLLKQPIELV